MEIKYVRASEQIGFRLANFGPGCLDIFDLNKGWTNSDNRIQVSYNFDPKYPDV